MEKVREMRTLKKVKTEQGDSLLEKFKNDEDIKWGIIFSQTSNAYQFYIPKEDYYIESSSSLRCGIPEKNNGGFIFDVASAPHSCEEIRDKLIEIAIEKMQNDIYSINSILNTLNEEKEFKNEKVLMKDIVTKINEKNEIKHRKWKIENIFNFCRKK